MKLSLRLLPGKLTVLETSRDRGSLVVCLIVMAVEGGLKIGHPAGISVVAEDLISLWRPRKDRIR